MTEARQIMEMVAPMIAVLGFFVMVGWVVWVLNRGRRERTARLVELQNRMLEKFASSEEFVAFLQTPEGQQYLKSFTAEPRANPKEKILKSVRTGVILIVVSAGLMAIGFIIGLSHPTEDPPFVIGFLAMFLGIGFLASAAVSYYMSKAWGLFPGESNQISKES